MSSSSSEAVSTDTDNYAVDERITLQNGTILSESLLQANDDAVVRAALEPMVAAWQVMANSGNLNLLELTDMGNTLISQIDKSQIQLSKQAETILREGTAQFEQLLKSQVLTVRMVGETVDRSLDTADRAMDMVAEVKTADFSDLSKSVMVFALAAIAIAGYFNKD